MKKLSLPTLIILVAVTLIILLLVIQDILLMSICQAGAAEMGVNWMWHPVKGCSIQQPDGSWLLIDKTGPLPPFEVRP
jgi:hypothetical protein